MKKLIILLTLVLSFSFADAMSLRIKLSNIKDLRNKGLISLTYTIENSLTRSEPFLFELEGFLYLVPTSERNKKEFEKLNAVISDKLKLKSRFTHFANRKKQFNPESIHYFGKFEEVFLDLLIANDWMITEHNNDGKGRVNIFAYKQN